MRTPFKLKSSPTKGKLGDFFKKATPETKAKRAKAKATRKAGESQHQANVRTRREANRASKKTTAAKTATATKNKSTDKEITVKKSDSNNYTHNTGKNNDIKATTATFGQAFKAARKKHGGDGGTFKYKGKKYSTNTKK